MERYRPNRFTGAVYRFDPIDHALFCLFAGFNAGFALVQLRGTMLTTEIPTAAVARHEGHLDSILGFASMTLASTTGFRHRDISMTGRIGSREDTRCTFLHGLLAVASCEGR